jgi:lipopolysaccharide/colanic/teichoic acid biosynthesis glycosyltransferase
MKRHVVRWLFFGCLASVVATLAKVHAAAIGDYDLTQSGNFRWILLYAGVHCFTGYVLGLPDGSATSRGALLRTTVASGMAVAAMALLQASLSAALIPRFVLVGAPLLIIPLGLFATSIAAWLERRDRRAASVVVVAGRQDLGRLDLDISSSSWIAMRVAAAVTPDEVRIEGHVANPVQPLVELVERSGATLLVLSRHAQDDEGIVAQATLLHGTGVRIRTLSKFYEENLGKLPLGELERISLLFDISEVHPGVYPRVKRLMDVVAAAIGAALLLPLVPTVWFINRFANRGPLFYRQERVGRRGEVFEILKFRSMRAGNGSFSWTSDNDDRITPFGRILRRSHLDELPQVLNILRGDLAIVGPRPEQPHYVEELKGKLPFYDLRHVVRPGLTGWAQVRYQYGASEADALEKLQYEFYYLRHQSVLLDLSILVSTTRSMFAPGAR